MVVAGGVGARCTANRKSLFEIRWFIHKDYFRNFVRFFAALRACCRAQQWRSRRRPPRASLRRRLPPSAARRRRRPLRRRADRRRHRLWTKVRSTTLLLKCCKATIGLWYLSHPSEYFTNFFSFCGVWYYFFVSNYRNFFVALASSNELHSFEHLIFLFTIG